MIRGRAASRTRGGFTLIEVLVTILIMSGIMLAVSQVLNAARISRDTIHNVQETALAGPAIMNLIERDVRGIVTYCFETQSMLRIKDHVIYGLDADSIDFVTTTDSLTLWEVDQRYVKSDLNEVGYRLRANPIDKDLLEIYRRESFGIDDEPFDGGQYAFLHDRVKHFDIQVYDEDGPDAEPLDEWDASLEEQEGLPLRIEISLTLELAPRINREQMAVARLDKREVTYKRVIRTSDKLMQSIDMVPTPKIPVIEPLTGAGDS